MQTIASSFTRFTNAQLVDEVKALASREREATAQLIASLAELEDRGLHLADGCSSLFTYCRTRLQMSEDAAYNRFKAASAARKFPIIIERLAVGAISLTAVRLLAAYLTPENHRALLDAAAYKSKREVEQQVAALAPRPALASSLRKLPASTLHQNHSQDAPPSVLETHGASAGTPATSGWLPDTAPQPLHAPPATRRPPIVAPLAPNRYRLQVTISREAHDTLRRIQDLLRHAIPDGDPAAIVERALGLLLAEVERRKFAKAARPRSETTSVSKSRHLAAAVKRAVWARDGGRCAFAGTNGRCSERGFLEYHHMKPFAEGGETTVENLELRCRAHNAYEAAEHFGLLFVRELLSADGSVRHDGPLVTAAHETTTGCIGLYGNASIWVREADVIVRTRAVDETSLPARVRVVSIGAGGGENRGSIGKTRVRGTGCRSGTRSSRFCANRSSPTPRRATGISVPVFSRHVPAETRAPAVGDPCSARRGDVERVPRAARLGAQRALGHTSHV